MASFTDDAMQTLVSQEDAVIHYVIHHLLVTGGGLQISCKNKTTKWCDYHHATIILHKKNASTKVTVGALL